MVFWSAGRFPPADDGHYYHVLAGRMAMGQGYTWLWPDGVVTSAAHYPVGYPAILAGLYALGWASPNVAMLFNACLGSAAAYAAHFAAARCTKRLGALFAGLFVALHPSLVMYTPALMTEGVVAALLLFAAAFLAQRAGSLGFRITALGLLLGVTTLIRPQVLLLAPLLGLVVSPEPVRTRLRAWHGLGVTLVTVAVCLPWTLRNCDKMQRCVFVSANGGWNLLIGTAKEAHGGFLPLEKVGVPATCREVFKEAHKDSCFAVAAGRRIAEDPVAWLALVPQKLSMTFDYSGTAAYYLHASNPGAFDAADKLRLGIFETGFSRILLALSLITLLRLRGSAQSVRRALGVLGMLSLLTPHAYFAYLSLVVLTWTLGRSRLFVLAHVTAAAVAVTALTHAVFFGSGRYSLVTFGLVAMLAGCSIGPDVGAKRKTALATG